MKTLKLITTLTLALSAFYLPLSYASKEGAGKEGGGGNIVVNEAPGKIIQVDVANAVYWLKQPIITYLNMRNINYVRSRALGEAVSVADEHLFSEQSNVFTRLPDLIRRVTIRMKSACSSETPGHEDGSYNSMLKPSICISAKTLSEKLHQDNFIPQIFALILHEIGHGMGMDEPLAESFQRQALKDFRESFIYRHHSPVIYVTPMESMLSTFRKLPGGNLDLGSLNFSRNCRMGSNLTKDFNVTSLNLQNRDFLHVSVFAAKDLELYQEMLGIFVNVQYYNCIRDTDASEEYRNELRTRYNSIFGPGNEVSIKHYWSRLSLASSLGLQDFLGTVNPGFVFKKILSDADLKAEVRRYSEIRKILLNRADVLYQFPSLEADDLVD